MRSICLCLCIRIYTACTCTYNSDWQALDVCDSCKLSNMLWAFERQPQTILFVLGFRKIALPCCSFTSFTVLRWNGSSPKNARNVKRCEEVCRRLQLQAVRIAHDIGRICINWTEQHTSVDAWCVNDVLSVAGHEKPLEEEVLAAETCFCKHHCVKYFSLINASLFHAEPKHWKLRPGLSKSHPFEHYHALSMLSQVALS